MSVTYNLKFLNQNLSSNSTTKKTQYTNIVPEYINGLLDNTGKIASQYLPSGLGADEILEFNNIASFPSVGDVNQYYIDKTTNLLWRWTGSAYVKITDLSAYSTTSANDTRYIKTSDTILTNGNIQFGVSNESSLTTGHTNIAFGSNNLTSTTSASQNFAFGNSNLTSNTTGQYNIGFGNGVLSSNISGSRNIALGKDCLASATTNDQIAIGYQSLLNSTSGSNNIAIGSDALKLNVTGYNNVGVGYQTLINNMGHNNVAIGLQSGPGNYEGSGVNFNVCIGTQSGGNLRVGSGCNVTIGHSCGYTGIFSGGYNVCMGFANTVNNDCNTCVYLGAFTNYSASGNNNIAVGYNLNNWNGSNNIILSSDNTWANIGTNNYCTMIGNGSTTSTKISGIYGQSTTNPQICVVDSNHKLGSLSMSASTGKFLKSDGTNVTWNSPSGTIIQSQITSISLRSQIVSSSITCIYYEYANIYPTQSNGAEIITRNITCSNSSNTLEIKFFSTLYMIGLNKYLICLFKDSDATPLCTIENCQVGDGNGNQIGNQNLLFHTMTAGSTSQINFKIRIYISGESGNDIWVNHNYNSSAHYNNELTFLKIKEIAS